MYRGLIIYAPSQDPMDRLAQRLGECFDRKLFTVEIKGADQAAIPDLAAADLFLLGSLPAGDQPIHPDFAEILRALNGITLAGRVGGVFAVDSEPTLSAFRRALQDCELVLSDENFRNMSGAGTDSKELGDWVSALTRQLQDRLRGR
jgi:flavodoxin